MKKQSSNESISVIMPMRNSSTTVEKALRSLLVQTYPIKEIIVVDNASEDNSIAIVKKIAKKSKLHINIIARKTNGGIGSSYNLGVKKATSSLVILMHSDCMLLRKKEVEKLTKPFREDASVVATYATVDLPISVWNSYDFWEKCFFERQAGKGYAGPTAKFDCIKRSIYLKIGGFDTKNFGIGGEDMDLAKKIENYKRFVLSTAHITHLQYLGKHYDFKAFLKKKRQYAMIYGRLLRKRPKLFLGRGIILLIKPFLAVLPFLLFFNPFGIFIVFIYSFISTKRMFITKSTLSNWRIILLPFVNIFLIYYETFWIIASFLFGENAVS